jgi:outer membrane protein OmpA-like peptidoglycan-associated protein
VRKERLAAVPGRVDINAATPQSPTRIDGRRTMRKTLLILVFFGLAACDRLTSSKTATPTPMPSPTSTPNEGYAGQTEESSTPVSPERESEVTGDVEAPVEVNMDAADAENQLVKAEVLARIDVMPRLTPEEKDKLYVQVERARGMGKIVTIPFGTGKIAVGPAELAALGEKLKLPQIQKFAEDPTVVFVVLGFADKKGNDQKNLAISSQRADSVVKTLKDRGAIMNVIHAVGMGSSDIFDAKDFDKNRVVEVWAVLP